MKPFARGGKLYVKVKFANGQWSPPIATGFAVEQVKEAEAFRDQLQAKIDAGLAASVESTVAAYAKAWLEKREESGVGSIRDDKGRMERHVLPLIGRMRLDEVRPRHIRDMIKALRRRSSLRRTSRGEYKETGKPIAPRTVINCYTLVASMFRDAVIDELISATPCVIRRGDLPQKRDGDPEWRSNAIFTRAELEQIISDDRIPDDRRTFYALLFLTASRFGEAAALCWRHYDSELQPLGRIAIVGSYSTRHKKVKGTKTETPRKVPVHQVLAAILAEWKLNGWPVLMGRKPKADDLIVPSRLGKHRSNNHMLKKFHADLETIGLRVRRQHDTRRTFRTIAIDDGANEVRLDWIVYGRPPTVAGKYDEPGWASLCEVVQQMKITRRGAPLAGFGAFGAIGAPASEIGTEQEDKRHG